MDLWLRLNILFYHLKDSFLYYIIHTHSIEDNIQTLNLLDRDPVRFTVAPMLVIFCC